MERCRWCLGEEIVRNYHDEEWGKPLHDDGKHFEYLLMEAMQCGLNWTMMLKKREIFRQCFDGFDFRKVALYGEADVERILNTEGMIRSKRKIEAIINNAKCFLKVIDEWGSFDRYIWSFSEGYTFIYRKHQRGEGEARNELSDRLQIPGLHHHIFASSGMRDHKRSRAGLLQIRRAPEGKPGEVH